ncbi:unnamed protein product [Allacma fusca]|uniref:RING-type domain-containing protein n=1 Tax=Allacma fusca TaxID=39272 RepID=A0A8J2KEZ1_9HEXA|nr:unnamed protein product [Allacma fusca]
MEQFDQLLTCCVCLDRYRNPKLLPCQHSFCMEPCMEGLVDYVRRQVKCPECRAEHRIPYQGVQAFPTNVTLQRFLELHGDITGELPDPTSNQIMERCQICSEKAYLNTCAHCEKKVCPDCKDAHTDVIKREIARLSSQVRRVLHRLEDALSVTEKNLSGLKGNQANVLDEVDDLVRRFTKAIQDKGNLLRNELENYVSTELTTLNGHRTNLQTEISNIQSNCDLVDKHMVAENAGVTWDDQELMDTKDVFLKTMEFIRSFEHEPGDRRIRFSVNQDPNTIIIGLTNFADLIIPSAFVPNQNFLDPVQKQPAQSAGLMRSKSDHRLVQQYRDMDDLDDKPTSARSKYSKYGGGGDGEERKFRSRFTRRLHQDDDDGRVRFNDGDDRPAAVSTKARVIEADDAVKGPLSGVLRLLDSTRVLEKIVDLESPKKKPAAPAGPAVPLAVQQQMQIMQQQQLRQQQQQSGVPTTPTATPTTAPWRQASQEKSSTPKATTAPVTRKPSAEKARSESESSSSDQQSGSSSSSSRSVNTGANFTTEEVKQRFLKGNTPQGTSTAAQAAAKSASPAGAAKPTFRRNVTPVAASVSKEEEETETSSEESEETESDEPAAPPPTNTKVDKTDTASAVSRSTVGRDRDPPASIRTRAASAATREEPPTPRRRESESVTTRARDEPISTRTRDPPALERRVSRDDGASAYSSYRNRQPKSPPERHYGSGTSGSGTGTSAASRYGTSSTSSPYDYGLSRSRTGTTLYEPETPTSRLQNKYLNRSRHNLGGSVDIPDEPVRPSEAGTTDQWSSNGREKSRDKSKILSRSKSSHELAQEIEGKPEEEQSSLSSWARYLKSKYGKTANTSNSQEPSSSSENRTPEAPSTRGKSTSPQKLSLATSQYSAKKRLVFKFGSRGSDPGYFTWPRGIACGPDSNIVVADSSNHRIQVFDQTGKYIKDFGTYGNGDGEFDCLAGVAVNRIGQYIVSDRYNHRIQVFDPSGRFLRSFGSQGSTDGKFNYPWGVTTDALGFIYVCDKENHRVQVFQSDGTFVGKFGLGELEHPHYIGVTSTNKVVVSDTGHHRVYIFDVNGKVIGSIGTEGIEHGQFKLPRGVAVDEQGYIFVGDSGNNRIQIFNPDGLHIRSFGGWGCGDGEFKGLEGIAVNSQGNVLVCDRENHRIQVF